MLLHAVMVPPPAVVAAVAHVVQSVETVRAAPAPPPPPKGWLRRRGKEPPEPPVTEVEVELELDLVPAVQMRLPIAGFGNVTSGDAVRLADTLKAAAAQWACPTVYFAGGGALEFPDDRSVWAKLDGDVEGLVAVASGVIQSVASRGFFVDRRSFKPWVSVATITDATTSPHLERVVAALDAYRGEPWTLEWVSITKPSFDAALGGAQEVYRIPLATG
jgi:hypothetical protein